MDITLEDGRNVLADAKTKSRTLLERIQFGETLEDMLCLVGWYTCTRIRHGESDHSRLFRQ
jgi:hypothetical protein